MERTVGLSEIYVERQLSNFVMCNRLSVSHLCLHVNYVTSLPSYNFVQLLYSVAYRLACIPVLCALYQVSNTRDFNFSQISIAMTFKI